jgi:hypothetical protein
MLFLLLMLLLFWVNSQLTIALSQLKHLEKKRQEELDDWERLHKNEIFHKNAEISALRDQLHQAGLVPSTVAKSGRKTPMGALLFGGR